jgi:hypothetical protein
MELVDVMAGRSQDKSARSLILYALQGEWSKKPVEMSRWLEDVAVLREELRGLRGFEAAKRRTALLYEWKTGAGLLGEESSVSRLFWSQVSVWAVEDSDQTVLTEMDIEGWIFYASLCREAQGGTPLRISVADRVTVYRMVEARFKDSRSGDRQALLAIGPFWGEIRRVWLRAAYEEQQSWIQIAPLPPPMTATSLGYFESVLERDLGLLVGSLHRELGPFEMTGRL